MVATVSPAGWLDCSVCCSFHRLWKFSQTQFCLFKTMNSTTITYIIRFTIALIGYVECTFYLFSFIGRVTKTRSAHLQLSFSLGIDDQRGITHLASEQIFNNWNESAKNSIYASYFEIYNDEIKDLLVTISFLVKNI